MAKVHYTADQCLTGGYECEHRHRTEDRGQRAAGETQDHNNTMTMSRP